MLRIIKCSSPKGFRNTNLVFTNLNLAQKYTEFLQNDFLLERAKKMEFLLSKRKKKNLMFNKPKKYLLTKVGSKLLLWESLK